MTDPHRDTSTPVPADADAPGPGSGASGAGAGGRYDRLPTGPVTFGQTETGPDADVHGVAEWEPTTGGDTPAGDDARLAPWALFAAIVALATSMFVGWGIPVALVAVMAAVMSLRRLNENRELAMWALVLGLCATVFSAGWLIWATMQAGLFG